MKRVLITKLASLGDLVHALPALSDARAVYPDLRFDWVIDKGFQEIAKWHPSVDRVIVTEHRKWRSHPFSPTSRQEVGNMLSLLRKNEYDLVIDAQGNLKSAILSLFAKGPVAGWNASSVPEWGSHFLYRHTFPADKNLHAVDRIRLLFAQGLRYPVPSNKPDYGIDLTKLRAPGISLPSDYLLFVPIASYSSKLWSEERWKKLIEKAQRSGKTVVLPFGNQEEKERVNRLAQSSQAVVLPKLSLSEIGFVIQNASGMVCVDTGLSHVGAALGTPSVTLYGPTDPHLTGTVGDRQFQIESPEQCRCSQAKRCSFYPTDSFCMRSVDPETVWANLTQLLSSSPNKPFLQ